jgi:hypothetical protein
MQQTYEKGKLYDLSIIDLKTDSNQPRKSMDSQALEELAASIKTHGIIQPILFRVAADSPSLIENLLRQDLTTGEEAEALQRPRPPKLKRRFSHRRHADGQFPSFFQGQNFLSVVNYLSISTVLPMPELRHTSKKRRIK